MILQDILWVGTIHLSYNRCVWLQIHSLKVSVKKWAQKMVPKSWTSHRRGNYSRPLRCRLDTFESTYAQILPFKVTNAGRMMLTLAWIYYKPWGRAPNVEGWCKIGCGEVGRQLMLYRSMLRRGTPKAYWSWWGEVGRHLPRWRARHLDSRQQRRPLLFGALRWTMNHILFTRVSIRSQKYDFKA